MDNQTPPRDDDPSEMTDFEKNATFEEMEQFERESDTSDPVRIRQEPSDESRSGDRQTDNPRD